MAETLFQDLRKYTVIFSDTSSDDDNIRVVILLRLLAQVCDVNANVAIILMSINVKKKE